MLERFPGNPIITRSDIISESHELCDVSSVFNPGAIQYEGQHLLLLRVQNRGRRTYFLKAVGLPGESFRVDANPIHFKGIENITEAIYHIYDPRITQIEDNYYIQFAMDMKQGCRLGLAVTQDFIEYDFLGMTSGTDVRNGVLFPGKFNGEYLRLCRPNKVQLKGGPLSGSTIVLEISSDLLNWEFSRIVADGNPHYWDELIGSGPPPVKTRQGWLHVYHGVATHFAGVNIYQAGIMLLDLYDPGQVLGRGSQNILEPRELYELVGQVPNVVFPSGIIVDKYDSEGFAFCDSKVYLYYGAADTSVCLATATIKDLIDQCYI